MTMARKKSEPIQIADLALPESFEAFAAQVDSPQPEPAAQPVIGGMVEKRWSGIPMWACPRCRSTTFDAGEAKTHTCKQVRYASDKTD